LLHSPSAGAAIARRRPAAAVLQRCRSSDFSALQAFQSSANYNWAATAYPALIIVTTAILMDRARWQWVRWNLITCIALAAIMLAGALAALTVRPDIR
jgi:hypothetical protein